MTRLTLHPVSKQQFDAFLLRPAHAVIIAGPEGIGKFAVSQHLAAALLQLSDRVTLEKLPHFKLIIPDGQSISVEVVRELLPFTKLKVTGRNDIRRIILIDQAHLLTNEAQNALLKLLEEPPDDTIFVLNTANQLALLPTIRSRAQTITLQPPPQADLVKHFADQGHTATQIQQAYLMSGGLPGFMHALVGDNVADHALTQAATKAREILRADTFGRLALVDVLSKQKIDCIRTLAMLQLMAQAALRRAASTQTPPSANLKRWQHILQAAYSAESALQTSAQPKLVLTNLMLSL